MGWWSGEDGDEGMTPYVLYGPDYHHASAGIRAIHRLIHELNERGYPAYTTNAPNPEWHELAYKGQEAIAIYPEVISGNPLRARRVARWVLNTPGLLGGDRAYAPTEQVFSWDHKFYLAPILTVDVFEPGLFVPGDKKSGEVCYFGKGAYRGVSEVPQTQRMRHMTRTWPAKRPELAALLRATRTLYTYDDNTSLVVEAQMCGCRVVLMPEHVELDPDPVVSPEEHAARIDRFIERTQVGG